VISRTGKIATDTRKANWQNCQWGYLLPTSQSYAASYAGKTRKLPRRKPALRQAQRDQYSIGREDNGEDWRKFSRREAKAIFTVTEARTVKLAKAVRESLTWQPPASPYHANSEKIEQLLDTLAKKKPVSAKPAPIAFGKSAIQMADTGHARVFFST